MSALKRDLTLARASPTSLAGIRPSGGLISFRRIRFMSSIGEVVKHGRQAIDDWYDLPQWVECGQTA